MTLKSMRQSRKSRPLIKKANDSVYEAYDKFEIVEKK